MQAQFFLQQSNLHALKIDDSEVKISTQGVFVSGLRMKPSIICRVNTLFCQQSTTGKFIPRIFPESVPELKGLIQSKLKIVLCAVTALTIYYTLNLACSW